MWWCVVVRPRPTAACVCVVCMLACALVWLVFWVGVVGVCSGGGDTALACVCDARGVVGGVSWRVRLFWRRRGACAACGAGVVCVVARAGCSVWLGTRVCVVDRVVMSGWFVCLFVLTRGVLDRVALFVVVVAVCGCVVGGVAEVRGRVVGVAVV